MFDHYLADDQARRESLVDDWSEWHDEWLRQEEDLAFFRDWQDETDPNRTPTEDMNW